MLEVKSLDMNAKASFGVIKHDRTNISVEGSFLMTIIGYLAMNPFHRPIGSVESHGVIEQDSTVLRMSPREIHDLALEIVDLTMSTCADRGWAKQSDSLENLYDGEPRKAGF